MRRQALHGRIVRAYENVLGRQVRYVDWEGAADNVAMLQPGDIAVLENTRFFGGEEKNDPAVARRFAASGFFSSAPTRPASVRSKSK